jgi:hypothetical protein
MGFINVNRQDTYVRYNYADAVKGTFYINCIVARTASIFAIALNFELALASNRVSATLVYLAPYVRPSVDCSAELRTPSFQL